LTNVDISKAIDAALKRAAMPSDRLLTRLSAMASSDIGAFIAIRGGKLQVRLPKELTCVIKRIKQGSRGIEIELHDSLRAVELLGKYHGLWNRRERKLRKEFLRILEQRLPERDVFNLADEVDKAEEIAKRRLATRDRISFSNGDGDDDGGEPAII
jgi:hypothetical protein